MWILKIYLFLVGTINYTSNSMLGCLAKQTVGIHRNIYATVMTISVIISVLNNNVGTIRRSCHKHDIRTLYYCCILIDHNNLLYLFSIFCCSINLLLASTCFYLLLCRREEKESPRHPPYINKNLYLRGEPITILFEVHPAIRLGEVIPI